MVVARAVPPLLLALLAALALPGGARAAGSPRSLRIVVPAHAAAAPHWRTPPLHAAGGFDLVGAEWRAGADARVALRARRPGGRWTRWTRAVAGEPVFSGRATAAQLRGARPVHGLRVHAVATGRAPAAAAIAAHATPASADGRPPIVPRSAWDPHHDCRPRVPARYGRVDFAVVHHTESLSFYTRRQAAAIVLGICLFHRDGNGWNDIGYDLLVDRFGTVFAGRAGGGEQPVIGAQAGGWNTVSTGVAMIGSYSLAPPPAVALRALERVLAWKLSLAGLPATGAVRERSNGDDPGDNPYPRGALVRFQRISGHRDADLTDCPGAALYALLPRIRRAVDARMPAPRDLVTISPVGAPVDAGPRWLTGRLALASGRRPVGAPVTVEQQGADGAWRQVAATRTAADGIWSAAPTLTVSGPLRAVATVRGAGAPTGAGSAPAPAAPTATIVSQVVRAQVRAAVRLRIASRRLRAGAMLRIAGRTTPPKPRVRVLVERRSNTGAYRRVLVRTAAPSTAGRFALALRLHRPGAYRLLAVTRADATNAAGSSRAVAVRVLARR